MTIPERPQMRDLSPLRDLHAAFGLLTRLPLPPLPLAPSAAGRPAVWAWPVVGATLGAICALAGQSALALGLPVGLAAAIVLGVAAALTGALHEDGLADCADGFWGGWTRERRLEIMKDSHIGSYGVLALIVTCLARWSAVVALLAGGYWAALIAATALSRAPMAGLMALLPNARGHGLSATIGRPSGGAALVASAVALVLALGLAGTAALPMALAVAGVTIGLGALARAKIGGQTGDVLGASQQLGELAALAAACAWLG